MVSRVEQQVVAQELIVYCDSMDSAFSDVQAVYYQFMAESPSARGNRVGSVFNHFGASMEKYPFERMRSDMNAILAGNVSWTAERDGKRLDSWWLDELRDGDFPWYVDCSARYLGENPDLYMNSPSGAALADALIHMNDIRQRMVLAIESLE